MSHRNRERESRPIPLKISNRRENGINSVLREKHYEIHKSLEKRTLKSQQNYKSIKVDKTAANASHLLKGLLLKNAEIQKSEPPF